MNFHISNLSPLRPRYSSSPLLSRPSSGHGPTTTRSGPVKIAVEPADDSSSSSTTDTDDDSPSDVSIDGNEDSRDVLVQRLTDLAKRLGDATVRPASIAALHKQVDAMEEVLLQGSSSSSSNSASDRSPSRRLSSPRRGPGSLRPTSLQLPTPQSTGAEIAAHGRDSLGVMAPMSPSWFLSHFQRRPSVHQDSERAGRQDERNGKGTAERASVDKLDVPAPSVRTDATTPAGGSAQLERTSIISSLASLDPSTTAPRISSQVAEDAIKEAEKLCAEMATVIESLQKRREVSDHLQTVLVHREEVAHQRLLETALAARELEDVVADNETELRHLRLELRALEVQCMGDVPKGSDPKLEESIRNWKSDWHALREKWAALKGSS